MIVHGVDEVFGAHAVLHATDLGADAGVAFHGGAELSGFGQPGGGHADRRDFHAVDLHLLPVIEIEEGEGFGDVHHFFGESVFEDGVVHALSDERGIDAEADAFFVSDGVSFHKTDGIGEAENLHLGFQRLARDNPAVFDVVGDGAQFLKEGFGAEKNGKAVTFDLGIVGIEHPDGGGDVQAVDGPAGEDVDGAGIHSHGENRGGVVFDEVVVVLFDFSLEGALAIFFYARRDVAVGSHVDVIGTGFGAGSEDRWIDEAGAGVDGDEDLLFLDEGGEGDGVIGVELDDLKPAVVGLRVEDVGELGLHVTQIDIAVAVVGMEALTDH